MEKTPPYTKGGTRDPRNPKVEPEDVNEASEKARDAKRHQPGEEDNRTS